ncbi:hypothetical protein BKA62DRAFT_776055 [Auriculariales sp. MPI-PUGE-AT-0066]|nr:hypothetical protein BKA62DRAFT_776055 [Auriculariales sp. MPI-PUGE-AT-0066]
MLGTSFLALAFALAQSTVLAATTTFSITNDIHTSCADCSSFRGNGRTTAFTSFSLTGPSNGMSDFTASGGWRIEGCDPNWKTGATHVKIVCAGTRLQQARCAQLFDGGGAKDTIVKLPQNCGSGPIARVVASVDITKANKFYRGPETHAVVLDYNFGAIETNRGDIDFEVTTSNVADTGVVPAPGNGDVAVSRREDGQLLRRWEKTKMFDLPAINVDKTWNMFSTSISCPAPEGTGIGFDASISVDADVKVDAHVGFGFAVAGKIFPPKITKMQVLGTLNGSASGEFVVKAQATGSFDTGSIPIYEMSLGGIDIPGILKVGPTFGVYGNLNADVGVAAQVKAGVAWNFPDVEMAFPQDSGASSANAAQVSNPLIVSLDPTVSAHGTVNAGLIPRIDLGISILSGLAQATVYLDVAATAVLDLNIEGHATVDAPINASTGQTDVTTSTGASGCAKLNGGIDISVGAKGSIKPIFDKEVNYSIFNKELEVFNKCFGAGDAAATRRTLERRERAFEKRDFICPALGLADLLELINL